MRIVVAGAAGFIGSHLTERLLQLGHDVVGVDSLVTGQWNNVARFHDRSRFSFVSHDVVDPLHLDGPIDWLFHLASPASPPKYQQHAILTLRSNAEGTYQLLRLAHGKGARLLLASTSEVYGDPHEHPQREGYWGHVNPIGPRSMYDEAKRYAEALVSSYHRDFGLPVRIVRIFNTYGPRMRLDDGRVVVNFIRQALAGQALTIHGDGSQTRSFQYVDDLVEALIRLMEIDYPLPVNIGNPDEFSVRELAAMVKDLTGSRSPIEYLPLPPDDPRQRRPDISLARQLLGWQPRVSLPEGLAATIDHFRSLIGRSRIPGIPQAAPVTTAQRTLRPDLAVRS